MYNGRLRRTIGSQHEASNQDHNHTHICEKSLQWQQKNKGIVNLLRETIVSITDTTSMAIADSYGQDQVMHTYIGCRCR